MTCTYCGTILPLGALFCGECGRRIVPGPPAGVPKPGASKPGAAAGSPQSADAPAAPRPSSPRRQAQNQRAESLDVPSLEVPLLESAPLDTVPMAPIARARAEEPSPLFLSDERSPDGRVSDGRLSVGRLSDDRDIVTGPRAPAPPAASPLTPAPAPADAVCAQCGHPMAPDDIFCGECGFVSSAVTQAFSGVIPTLPPRRIEQPPRPSAAPRAQPAPPSRQQPAPSRSSSPSPSPAARLQQPNVPVVSEPVIAPRPEQVPPIPLAPPVRPLPSAPAAPPVPPMPPAATVVAPTQKVAPVPPLPGPPPAAEPRPTPAPWAAPQGSSDEEDAADLEATRIVARSSGERFALQFSTGESVTVYGTGLIGRNPRPEPGEFFDQLVRVLDGGRSVSKTHLEFGQEGGVFWVKDRFSGNGTVVREPETEPRRCEADRRYRVIRGSRVEVGEQFFVVS